MNGSRKNFRILFITLAVLLVMLLAWYGILRTAVNQYNATLRSDKTDEGLNVQIYFRGGSTDSWVKIMNDGSEMTGTIFEMSAANVSSCEISDWTERIDITKDCCINNAWCGKFEVHQFVDGAENVQTLDLREYSAEDITLDYRLEGQDLMIPLHSGDYLLYLPSTEVYEMPLTASATASVGFILYYEGDAPDFSSAEASFHYKLNYAQSPYFKAFLIALCLWGVALIIAVSLFIYARGTLRKLEERERNFEESVGVFSEFVDAKDAYTNGHSKRVALYAVKIAKALGYNEQACKDVHYIGLMHDCGKCYIPDSILKKPGRLTDEEYDIIKSHTTRGAELLKNFKSLPNIREGALYHHERYDGKGYPCGKAGKDIPEIGRILAVADAFDAMNTKRVYRDPLSKETILKELRNGRGTQFDPDILDVFMKLIDNGEIAFSSAE